MTHSLARYLNPIASTLVWAALSSLLIACGAGSSQAEQTAKPVASEVPADSQGKAVFAGGCFWCTESDFDKVPGVISTTSGYTGGNVKNPTYEQVSAGGTGHVESVQVVYDTRKTSYAKLLEAFWPTIDPITANAQFCDHGTQYRSAIFYGNEREKTQAMASKEALQASGRFKQPIVTEIIPASTFYPAEEYHQNYHSKNPLRYSYYRNGCGRDDRLEQLWGKKG